jgi:hypothetical protein
MAMPTPVNSQITDAVAETNTKALGDAPAIALGNLFTATAQALSNAAHNAVNNQQQGSITSLAATTQAVMLLLSVDTASGSASANGDKAQALPQALAAMAAPDAAVRTIEQAVESVSKLLLDSAGPWSGAVRELMAAVAGALRELQAVAQEANLATVKQAAIAAVLVCMMKAPDQLEQYQKILALIKEI